MIISILAMDKKGLIGIDNKLPWKNSADLNFFYSKIKNNKIIMGSNTFFNLPKKFFEKAKNTEIYVINTFQENLDHKYSKYITKTFYSLDSAKKFILQFNNNVNDIYICGGQFIYETFLVYSNYIFQTIINEYDEILNTDVKTKKFINIDLFKGFSNKKLIYKDEKIEILQLKKEKIDD
ncbi:dihydrofolate reductase [Mycoplasma leonicaptivi]|uniref:dihydrofolate reductase n=1 Tax=Mycoplasma leonicaptivi TaxID=36742 RepID=UPI0004898FD8|nr:dihydrofolate reductase [Mycoplasma leonicaptivi]